MEALQRDGGACTPSVSPSPWEWVTEMIIEKCRTQPFFLDEFHRLLKAVESAAAHANNENMPASAFIRAVKDRFLKNCESSFSDEVERISAEEASLGAVRSPEDEDRFCALLKRRALFLGSQRAVLRLSGDAADEGVARHHWWRSHVDALDAELARVYMDVFVEDGNNSNVREDEDRVLKRRRDNRRLDLLLDCLMQVLKEMSANEDGRRPRRGGEASCVVKDERCEYMRRAESVSRIMTSGAKEMQAVEPKVRFKILDVQMTSQKVLMRKQG